MSGKQTSPENPHKYGTPEFGHWRTQQKLREASQQSAATARQAQRRVEQSETLFTQRMADMQAEKSAADARRKAAQDAALEPERVRRRRQYLIEHADLGDAGYVFDTKVWPLLRDDIRDNELIEQAANSFRAVGWDDARSLAAAREIINERARKAGGA